MEERRRIKEILQMKLSNQNIKHNIQVNNPELKKKNYLNERKILRENSFEMIKKNPSIVSKK